MDIPHKAKQIYLIILISSLLAACQSNKVDVSNIKVQVKIERFDKDFDFMRTRPMADQSAYLKKKYGAFYNTFIGLLLQDAGRNTNDTGYFATLRTVFKNKDYIELKHDVDSVYPNLNSQEATLQDAFKHILYYFPQKKLPRVYTFYSGFEDQIAAGEGYIAIGLDLFLGKNSRFYPRITNLFPRYMSKDFNPEDITPRVIEGLAREDMFPEDDTSKTLLSKMIYNGKILYFMDKVLPDLADTIKIAYTGKQLEWCKQYQSMIWANFLEENLLYETDFLKIQKYVGPAPFTPGLGEHNESAPKLGVWTGWQIVRLYMEKHPEVTLKDLMLNNDYQKILTDANYRPKSPDKW